MSIVLEQLSKRYEGHPVINHVSVEVANGEFFVLLGPSGSGKSTILRTIAGLVAADQGRVLLHGRDVTHLPVQQRGVGFVFQHYALFQHMSVAENIEFGLRIRKVPRAERRRRRDELLNLVGLAGLGRRMPAELSGGQQQRVALARALAYQPEVLLLDEPFGALDAKIRVDLRRTLRDIQRELGTTTIFVTHDQEEAFELADRIGVMNFGRLLEVGSPDELYARPQTEFVATFLGTANLLVGRALANSVSLGPVTFPLMTAALHDDGEQSVQVLFRPEDVLLAASPEELPDSPFGLADVDQVSFAGSFERLRLRLPPIPGVRPIAPVAPFGSRSVLVEATRSQDLARQLPLQPGDRVWVSIRRIHALVHPGMRFLLLTDGTSTTQATLHVGGQIARLAHARTTLLAYGGDEHTLRDHLQAASELLGSGLASLDARVSLDPLGSAVHREIEQEPFDLVVLSAPPEQRVAQVASLLQAGAQHVLLVTASQSTPLRVLICVAAGEPSKDDILFASRLLRHFGAEATLLSVLAPDRDRPEVRAQTERFLEAGLQTMAVLGVDARHVVRVGTVRAEILAELATGGYDLLVLGTPLGLRPGRAALDGVTSEVLAATPLTPALIARSGYARPVFPGGVMGRAAVAKEVL